MIDMRPPLPANLQLVPRRTSSWTNTTDPRPTPQMENPVPRCRLCLEEKEKLCKAHLLPESFYRFIKFDEDRLIVIPGMERLPFTTTPIGRWDDQILCSECDQKLLGPLDEYAAKIFLELGFSKHWIEHPELTCFFMKDVDIPAIKLFWVSVLWRHAISGLPENSEIDLPEDDLETIRQMILRRDPGSPDDYSVALTYFGYPPVIMALSKSETDDGWSDYFVCGWHIWIKGARTPTRTEFRSLFLDPESDIKVIVRSLEESPRMTERIRKFVLTNKTDANRAYGEYRRRQSLVDE